MSDSQKEFTAWLEGWKNAESVMDNLKRERLDHIDIAQVVEQLDDAFVWALAHSLPKKYSGLVQFQRWLARTHP